MAGDTVIAAAIHDPPSLSRFWAKVDKSAGPSSCWIWTAGRQSQGYGAFYLPGRRQVLAHRFALMLEGEVPADGGQHALHSCDNPPCCNPKHLHWGSHSQNMNEMADRRRAKSGLTLGEACPQGHAYTSENILTSSRKGARGKRYIVHSCRECNRIYLANRRARRRGKVSS